MKIREKKNKLRKCKNKFLKKFLKMKSLKRLKKVRKYS